MADTLPITILKREEEIITKGVKIELKYYRTETVSSHCHLDAFFAVLKKNDLVRYLSQLLPHRTD